MSACYRSTVSSPHVKQCDVDAEDEDDGVGGAFNLYRRWRYVNKWALFVVVVLMILSVVVVTMEVIVMS